MKKFITVLVLAFTLGMNAQGNEDIERYKLYPTENMWTFLELDTATGLIWQIQYDVEGDNRFKFVLNGGTLADRLMGIRSYEVLSSLEYYADNPLSIIKPAKTKRLYDDEYFIGRYKLYPTKNMYNFLLLDVTNGRVSQFQWSNDKDSKRGLVHVFLLDPPSAPKESEVFYAPE